MCLGRIPGMNCMFPPPCLFFFSSFYELLESVLDNVGGWKYFLGSGVGERRKEVISHSNDCWGWQIIVIGNASSSSTTKTSKTTGFPPNSFSANTAATKKSTGPMCRIPSSEFPPYPLPYHLQIYITTAPHICPLSQDVSSIHTYLVTFQSTTLASSSDPRQNQGIHNQDHPKVYIAWDKHPAYHTRNTGFKDPISQSTSSAFRSRDWWYFIDRGT